MMQQMQIEDRLLTTVTFASATYIYQKSYSVEITDFERSILSNIQAL